MRALDEVFCLDYALQLPFENWDRRGRLHVCLRCEQAEQAGFSNDLPVFVHPPETYVVHAIGPMNRRLAVGLGEDEQFSLEVTGSQVVRQVR